LRGKGCFIEAFLRYFEEFLKPFPAMLRATSNRSA